MNSDDFTSSVEAQIRRCTQLLIDKASEYAPGSDRLHNFKQAAHLQEITPYAALGGMLSKHVISVYDMLSDEHPGLYPDAVWNEKITDTINYLLILRAMVDDEKSESIRQLRLKLTGEEEPS